MKRILLRVERCEERVVPADVSAPLILQWFDGSFATIERRLADVFAAGYGNVYTPPPGRADSGNQSVGYDVYDRFDLGGPGNPTLYGTETGLKQAIAVAHRMGGTWTLDFVANHNGFSDLGTPGFANAGGYPGFAITLNPGNNNQGINDIDGDFHGVFETGDIHGRLAGLIDIAQEKNYQFVRNPVLGFANNLPAGTTPAFGRLANVPDEANRRFYPDQGLPPIFVFDPMTGESNIPIYPFNANSPSAGDPVAENALGYLMRNAQWLVQVIGADGLRFDAAKHFERFVLNYLDRAVYRQNPRPLLDGSTAHPFSFSEVFDGDRGFQQQFIRKDINPSDPGRVGGNRDVLDFPLFFAMRSNLTDNGFTNDWRNVKNASQDVQDDGLANNGSQGVSFVSSHDEFGPYLGNVAYAYTLMRPGNAVVYFNGKEFGPDRDFPKDGRGDALGGLFGDAIKTLVDIRNTHGRGNYIDRTPGGDEKEMLVFERDQSALVVLSNRMDGGFDSRTIQTNFAPGTPLIELTGNAGDPLVDPFDDFPSLLIVNGDGTVNLRVPRNRAPDGNEHGRGYFVYGVAGPQGTLSLTDVDHTIAGETPTASTNGTARLSAIDVITSDSFMIQLNTVAVNLLGFQRDVDADGDNALFRIDGGLDFNTIPGVDFTGPNTVSYGFEQFTQTFSPGYFSGDGNGVYAQTIDSTQLGEGIHFVTIRAFRHREPGQGEAVYSDFRRTVYVDRLPAVSTVESFDPTVAGVNENRRAVVRSVDLTADNVHVFLDLPAGLTDAQVIGMVGAGSQATKIDRDLWTRDFSGLTHGNHVLTVVTFEISGRATVQRSSGLFTSTIFGAGLGDVDFDGDYDPVDVTAFNTVLVSHNAQFNPAADLTGDGLVNNTDLIQLRDRLISVGASQATLDAYQFLLGPPLAWYAIAEGDGLALTVAEPSGTLPELTFAWDLDNDGQFDDALGAGTTRTWLQLVGVGIDDDGSYPLKVRVSDGTATTTFDTTLAVANTAPTATLSNDGPKNERQLVTVSFANPFDPSVPDTAAGFTYFFDFNNDGDFTDPGDVNGTADPQATFRFPHEGMFLVRARIQDEDGDFTDATTAVTVVNVDRLVVGADAGGGPHVRVFDAATGAETFGFFAYPSTFTGGVRVAAGDVTGDGVPDVVTAAGATGGPHVKVFDGVTLAQVHSFFAYPSTFTGGVYVAVGDVNGDGRADIITGAGANGGPHVKVFHGQTLAELHSFFAYGAGFTGGVRVAAGDVTGDGKADVLTAPGATGGPHVRVFSGTDRADVYSFLAFDAGYTGGLFVAAGDLDGDGRADMIVGQGTATPAAVRVFGGNDGGLRGEFSPFAGGSGGAGGSDPAVVGVRVSAVDRDGDGLADVVAGTGPGFASRVHTHKGTTLGYLSGFGPYDPAFLGGVFVG